MIVFTSDAPSRQIHKDKSILMLANGCEWSGGEWLLKGMGFLLELMEIL